MEIVNMPLTSGKINLDLKQARKGTPVLRFVSPDSVGIEHSFISFPPDDHWH